ncbi:uncharacterized protein MONOS_8925 [Monocercomonoides exilis]|uniref:uncharacterized protein n=1 Tax=Monocercomonoides exilis TaxID=2049356 RepID=UPI003559C74E|nr:hypothetical protein MONOS_8925 [Monocercomonoides exilis]|eukprot:MONOS_8925.1-p1 / transcript=MONOS_8925.1 / gene=MONOS_8925 / organism=Monocercomonoides_exilis_PA203 / gene_product=unspecified product / transcript_product=unspecified product / location=Mono_scaffold00351:33822-34055(+) / protein_length=78 / sequence_SO=supercontig / SO=protein_coding / is_pseudo=false
MVAQQQQLQQQRQIVHGAAVERFPQERLAKHLRHDVRLRRVISCPDGLAQLVIALHLVGRWNIGLRVGSTAALLGVS